MNNVFRKSNLYTFEELMVFDIIECVPKAVLNL
jgi:hypothetical protein